MLDTLREFTFFSNIPYNDAQKTWIFSTFLYQNHGGISIYILYFLEKLHQNELSKISLKISKILIEIANILVESQSLRSKSRRFRSISRRFWLRSQRFLSFSQRVLIKISRYFGQNFKGFCLKSLFLK